jgi:5-methylcytosine-specific restriction endonuclease McrA
MSGRQRLYCSRLCGQKFRSSPTLVPTKCQNCHSPIPPWSGKGRPKRNCSRDCGRLHDFLRNRKLKPKLELSCHHCQAKFYSAAKRRFCSRSCGYARTQIEQSNKGKDKRRQKVDATGFVTTICSWCKEPRTYEYQQGGHNAYHPDCTIEARRARYRIKTVKRQGLVNKPSRLAADEVVRVYGNNCAICNEPIDLSLKRTSSKGLTVDHWIPLSKGGSDDMSNLRPAHWNCNRKKSDKLPKEVNA